MASSPQKENNTSQEGGFDQMVDRLWNQLKSMKFAILILLIIAAASIFNLFANEFILPVRGGASQAYATWEPAYGAARAGFLTFMQMYSPYTSWWYTVLLGLLLLSLIVCVIDRAPIVWRLMTVPRFIRDRAEYKDVPDHAEIRSEALQSGIERVMHRFGFVVRRESSDQGDTLLAGARFSWAHSGPWLVHVGFILLVLGGAMIARGAYQTNVGGLPGDLLMPNEQEWGFNVRVDDFQVHYHPLGPSQYVQVDGGAMIGRIIRKHADATFDLEIFSPRNTTMDRVSSDRIQNRIDRRMQGGRLDQANIADYVATLTVIENGREIRTEEVEVNHPLRHNGYRFYQSSFNDRRMDSEGRWMTILNVRKDRGAPFVWAGILLVTIGLVVGMYFEPQRLYAHLSQDGTTLHLAGRSERNRTLFTDRFQKIVNSIERAAAPEKKEAS